MDAGRRLGALLTLGSVVFLAWIWATALAESGHRGLGVAVLLAGLGLGIAAYKVRVSDR